MTECARCATPGNRAFCGNCGAALAADAPTATAAAQHSNPGVANDPTHYVAAEGANQRPYEGYQSAGFAPPSAAAATHDTTGATTDTARMPSPPSRTPNVLIALTAVAATVVLALVAFLLLRPGQNDGGQNNGTPAVISSGSRTNSGDTSATASETSTASSDSSSSQSSSTSTTSEQTSQPAAETTTVTSTQSANPNDGDFSAVTRGADSVTDKVTVGGTSYQAARVGNTVTIYEGSSDGKKYSVGILGKPGDLALVALSQCSHPILLHNAANDAASAAYGWDGSGYQAYKSDGEDLNPDNGNGAGATAHGVNEYNGGVEYRDSAKVSRGNGNHFYQCTGSSGADVLDFAGKGN